MTAGREPTEGDYPIKRQEPPTSRGIVADPLSSVHHEHVAGTRDASIVLNDLDVRSFRENGFAVLTDAFAADELAAEMDDVFADAFGIETMQDGAGGIRFASVPMMSERTPTSSLLADALAEAAAQCARSSGTSGPSQRNEVPR